MSDSEFAGLKRFDSIFRRNGWDPESQSHVTIKDALDTSNAAFLIPRVLTQIVQEGIEPLLIGANLLQRVDYVPGMQTVFPAIEPLWADEAADTGGLPIHNINIAGASSYGTTVKRHGLMLKVNQRFIEESTYPWLNYWLRLAGNALARHKEEYIFTWISQLGTLVFDNLVANRQANSNPKPIKGCTTGRNYMGKFNGSMTVDDIFDQYSAVLLNGFVPDTLLVHPMAWLMWVKDPVMREFAIQAGGGSFFQQWQGNPAALGNKFFNFGGMGFGQGQTSQYGTNGLPASGQASTAEGLPQNQVSGPNLPGYLGLPFKILVSPFMRFDPRTRQTDILMFNSQNLGAMIVKKDPEVKSWEDNMYNIQSMAIEEEYGFGIINEGQAIAVARNVKVRPNEFVMPARTVFNLSEANNTYQDVNPTNMFGGAAVDPNNI